jgi:hypothetical protein
MMSSPTNQPQQLNRIYYKKDVLRIRDVANSFQEIDADTAMKGEREMSVCEMQKEYDRATSRVHRARYDSAMTVWRQLDEQGKHVPPPKLTKAPDGGGIGAFYCSLVSKATNWRKGLKPKEAHAAVLSTRVVSIAAQDTTKQPPKPPTPVPVTTTPAPATTTPAPAPAAATQPPPPVPANYTIELLDAKNRIEMARHEHNRFGVEIQKKFSLAAACIVLVLVGAPIALRVPNGGVGLVFGVSFLIFSIYYVGLIGGEALSDKAIISPFWANAAPKSTT